MSFRLKAISATFVLAGTAAVSTAHVTWTRLNLPDPTNFAVYHLDDTGPFPDGATVASSQQNAIFDLIVDPTFVGGGTVTSSSETFTVPAISNDSGTNAGSLIFSGTVNTTIPSTAAGVLTPNFNDNTVEFWFKWPVPFTTPQEVRVGGSAGAKIIIKRDPVTPANDRFGLLFSHGDTVPAPGWVNGTTTWNDFPTEAPLGDWIHVAVATDSTGVETSSPAAVALGHELYQSGSRAWIYVSGHKFGTTPDFIDLGNNLDVDPVNYPTGRGIRTHDAARFRIDNVTGTIQIDELTIWATDLSNQGTAIGTAVTPSTPTPPYAAGPFFGFGNGKGNGVASVGDWSMY
ncbi:hypothetical protein IT570_11655 [Candidatus Sumerlaeota bacterium]|nr:hypothetical protein [Candidatus Sumerlaeota bacterium]